MRARGNSWDDIDKTKVVKITIGGKERALFYGALAFEMIRRETGKNPFVVLKKDLVTTDLARDAEGQLLLNPQGQPIITGMDIDPITLAVLLWGGMIAQNPFIKLTDVTAMVFERQMESEKDEAGDEVGYLRKLMPWSDVVYEGFYAANLFRRPKASDFAGAEEGAEAGEETAVEEAGRPLAPAPAAEVVTS